MSAVSANKQTKQEGFYMIWKHEVMATKGVSHLKVTWERGYQNKVANDATPPMIHHQPEEGQMIHQIKEG